MLYTLAEGYLKGLISRINEKNKEHINFQFDSESIEDILKMMNEGSTSIFRERNDLK